MALGITTEGVDDEVSYVDQTKLGLHFLEMALRTWDDDPEGDAVVEILDRMSRELTIMRAVAVRERELRKAAAAAI